MSNLGQEIRGALDHHEKYGNMVEEAVREQNKKKEQATLESLFSNVSIKGHKRPGGTKRGIKRFANSPHFSRMPQGPRRTKKISKNPSRSQKRVASFEKRQQRDRQNLIDAIRKKQIEIKNNKKDLENNKKDLENNKKDLENNKKDLENNKKDLENNKKYLVEMFNNLVIQRGGTIKPKTKRKTKRKSIKRKSIKPKTKRKTKRKSIKRKSIKPKTKRKTKRKSIKRKSRKKK